MIPTGWQFGPFARGLAPAERLARLRLMRRAVANRCGDRGTAAVRALDMAETAPEAVELAIGALDRLPSLDRRHALATYQRLEREREASRSR